MENIGVLIYTHNRVDDARVNMEIIRHVWEEQGLFNDVKIVHAYNGQQQWYPTQELEDSLLRLDNSWHFQGASDLIDAGMEEFATRYLNVEYIIVLASDTWLVDSTYIHNILGKMKAESYRIATCPWGTPDRNDIRDVGVAVDFFILDAKWVRDAKMFPIDYAAFYEKHIDFMLYNKPGNVMLEKLLLARYLKAFSGKKNSHGLLRREAQKGYLELKERHPVHRHIDTDGQWHRNFYYPEMGLLTHHDPQEKSTILKDLGITAGKHTTRILESSDLEYFNGGVRKMDFSAN